MKESSNYQNLIEKSRAYLWHPFTQMQDYNASDQLIIERGEGIMLYDTEGNAYYDAISSLWVNIHGHRVPEIDQAIKAQVDRISHSTMLGQSSIPSIELAEKLIQIAPDSLQKVFYSDSGSEAVEIALKMAYHYWQHKGEKERRYFIRLENAYHGDTIGAVSAGGIDLFHQTYRHLLFPTLAVPFPNTFRYNGSAEDCVAHSLTILDKILETHR